MRENLIFKYRVALMSVLGLIICGFTIITILGGGRSVGVEGNSDIEVEAHANIEAEISDISETAQDNKGLTNSSAAVDYFSFQQQLANQIIYSSSESQNNLSGSNNADNREEVYVEFEDVINEDVDDINVDEMDISNFTFLKIYNQGTRDSSVAYIQQRLMDLGFMESAEPTEYYGSITMQAMKLFQRQNDLKQDGIAGEQTLALLLSDDAKSYLVKKGMNGDDIKRIQLRLYELGYLTKDKITGEFGSDTEGAVKALQTANSLVVDGIIGNVTIDLLYSGEVKANLLSFGDKSDIVLECQKRLKELGYLTTTPDGSYGNDTLAAVKLFQSRNDLVEDGYLGPSTRELLSSSKARPNGLELGDQGDTVKRVQELLIKLGYMKSGANTGFFGEVTENAVKAFQKNNSLSADGIVGTKTMNLLTGGGNKAGSSSTGSSGSTVDTGNGGSDVKAFLKVALSKLGCKYIYGAKGPNTFDCSGFVYWCLNQVGVKQSYVTSYGWRTIGKYKKISSYKDLRAGDIIVVTGHVGIIGENGTVIDASSSRQQIMHRPLSSWWSSRFIVGWRIFAN